MTWLLLMYSVPATPSRLRATIWREIKRSGAVYLRDGVCALPERDSTLQKLREIEAKVLEYGGHATLARSVQLDDSKSSALVEEASNARLTEYADWKQEATRYLEHLRNEPRRRQLSFSELELSEADLGKLRRWLSQIEERDFAAAGESHEVRLLLMQCEATLAELVEEAYVTEGAAP